jgi:hypothetical protein
MLLAEWAQAVNEFWIDNDIYGCFSEDTEMQKERGNHKSFDQDIG